MHCADCTICFLHLQRGGREGGKGRRTWRRECCGERELDKEGKKERKTRNKDKNKAGLGEEERVEVQGTTTEEEESQNILVWR